MLDKEAYQTKEPIQSLATSVLILLVTKVASSAIIEAVIPSGE